MGGKLKTQDKLKDWDKYEQDNLLCSLYSQVMDTHEHLIFECPFSRDTWGAVRKLARLDAAPSIWNNIIELNIISLIGMNISRNIIGKLVLGATAYFIWQERNHRLFKKNS